MFETLLRLWEIKKIDSIGINNAVTKNWITQEQADTILATTQDAS